MDSSCPQFRPAVEAERIQVGGLVGQMVGRRMERTLQAARRTAGRAFDGLVKRGRRREENPRANRGRGW